MNPENRTHPFGYEEAAIVRAMIQHENELLNNRIVWFITIEGLLFAALGFAWKDAYLLIYVLCALGIVTAVSSSIELAFSTRGINEIKRKWGKWLHQHEPLQYTGMPIIGYDASELNIKDFGLFFRPDLILPWIFAGAWTIVLIIHFCSPVENIQNVRLVFNMLVASAYV